MYYTISWFLPNPTDPFTRHYGLSSFDLTKNASYAHHAFSDNYYGVWCSKDSTSLLLVMSPGNSTIPDPLRASDFYIQSLDIATMALKKLAGPIKVIIIFTPTPYIEVIVCMDPSNYVFEADISK